MADIHVLGQAPSSTPAPGWPDFVNSFLDLTTHEISPEIFRRWTAIALVAGALERRVWVANGDKRTFPNLYTLLVAPPAVGKYVIELARDLWAETKEPRSILPAFRVAPDSMTKASLVDTLAKAKGVRMTPAGNLIYHSLLIAAEEFSVLLPTYDMEYVGTLNSLYMNKEIHEEVRRTGSVRELKIEKPQLNILAGVQPSYMASAFPEEIWQSGIARRMLMVYSNEEILLEDFFAGAPDRTELRAQIISQLSTISGLYGQAKWERAAMDRIKDWYHGGQKPKPTHSKLSSYVRARPVHLLKLSLVAAVATRGELVIRLPDIERAMFWLFDAERLMPDIFREMVGKSDTQVLEELHHFVQEMWLKAKRPDSGVRGSVIYHFLSQRCPSDKIEKILAIAERANILVRLDGSDNWLPKPKTVHGME